ncbi:ABC transporter, substrate-binding protein, aliphatic sulfonates family [Mycobacterium sp. JS623]|uniref:ABC transporter substrate-binding protein n=1 Tax=Mycobacterium sp. JS623 TaxID=212767 RepID=UPI0002A5ABD5|nr:ABC transporter substrate-binding protein [Mycobacterium sp. JS623]AGB22260.1 ABC transporter, substrate-binding protein, aliphatic sulfonates family [Mycobacterium sp. JS623]
MKRTRTAVIALVAAASLALAACGSADSPKPDTPVDLGSVTLKIGDQKGVALEPLMRAAGELDNLPYKIDFSNFTSGPTVVEAASAGGIDLGQVGNTPPIFGLAAKANIKIVGALSATAKGDAILVGKDSTLTSVADLKGKRVAVAKGTSANANLLLNLKRAGLTMSDIAPVYLQPGDGYSALTRGDVQAWATWDPYTAIAEQEVGAKVIATAEQASNGFNFWVASADMLDDRGRVAAIKDFLRRFADATAWSEQNTDAWSANYAELTQISADASKLMLTRSIKRPIPITEAVIASEQQLADAFTDAKAIPGKVEFADAVDERFQ